jgi:hypothetical protein
MAINYSLVDAALCAKMEKEEGRGKREEGVTPKKFLPTS